MQSCRKHVKTGTNIRSQGIWYKRPGTIPKPSSGPPLPPNSNPTTMKLSDSIIQRVILSCLALQLITFKPAQAQVDCNAVERTGNILSSFIRNVLWSGLRGNSDNFGGLPGFQKFIFKGFFGNNKFSFTGVEKVEFGGCQLKIKATGKLSRGRFHRNGKGPVYFTATMLDAGKLRFEDYVCSELKLSHTTRNTENKIRAGIKKAIKEKGLDADQLIPF